MNEYLITKDFSVSNEKYTLLHNESLDLLITHPQPEDLSIYYESEDYISHTDANNSFKDKVYQRVKKRTLQKKLRQINKYRVQNPTLLDVGCGTGDFLLVAEQDGWQVTGIELNQNAISLAKGKLQSTAFFESLFNPSLEGQKFDVITLWHVLEHLENTPQILSRLRSLLQPNGIIIIAVPNFKSFDAKYYQQYWAAYDVPRHLYHFSKKSITNLCTMQSLTVIKSQGMPYDAFYVSWLSEQYKKSRIAFVLGMCIGLVSNIFALYDKEYSSLNYTIKHK